MLKNIIIFLTFSLLVPRPYADQIPLHIATISDSPTLHRYYHELLDTALKADGHEPVLISSELPHLRAKSYMDFGRLSIHWMVESEQRNKKYISIDVGLTSGLIGRRVLFIKKGEQALYDKVQNLQDFRDLNLIGGFGQKWFDVKVWQANNLSYIEHSGNWKSIFKMVPVGHVYDYFSRGLNEILAEAEQHPDLAIEENLVLIYQRDFIFYLSKEGVNAGAKYKTVIEQALKKAKANGLIERLVEKHWAKDFKVLNYEARTKIYLNTPE